MKKEEKTNVMRVLDGKKISYESHAYKPDATMSGEEIAEILGEDPGKVGFQIELAPADLISAAGCKTADIV